MSLGLNLGLNDAPGGVLTPEPRHRSAGLAFGLSLLVPGTGQFYCGKIGRGGVTLVFWLISVLLCFGQSMQARGVGIVIALVLWIFSFLDAYFTAVEINLGQDEQVDVQNPRVAVVLNLLTSGWGYFYLGERSKGIALFMIMLVVRLLFNRTTGFLGGLITTVLMVVQILMALDAYRIAHRQLKESLEPVVPLPTQTPSRLPAYVPIAVACVLTAGSILLIVVGLTIQSLNHKPAMAKAKQSLPDPTDPIPAYVATAPKRSAPVEAASDISSAIHEVQWLEQKTPLQKEDIEKLKNDIQIFSTTLKSPALNHADIMTAHYFRARAVGLIYWIQHREGNPVDVAAGRQAVQDLNWVIAHESRTYVYEISVANAQYLAGGIERNMLHDEPKAYGYWTKCALSGHAGCLNVMAEARVTGAGGQKVDINEALNMHTAIFETGVQYTCAGASSAGDIAEIIHFMGIRRPGDDELEWMNKSYGLMDKVESARDSKDVCGRADAEVEEFLFRLDRGEREVNILGDAISRVDEESAGTKAVVQFLLGAIDEKQFESTVQTVKSEGARCGAYFDAMWYAEIMKDDARARHYHQRMEEIGKFYCGAGLAYANRYKL